MRWYEHAASLTRPRHASPGYQRVMRWASLAALAFTLTVTVLLLLRAVPAGPIVGRFQYGPRVFQHYERVRREFRPRVGTTLLVRSFYTRDWRVMRDRISWYFALWFLGCCIVYVLMDARAAPFLMTGTFAAIYYDCTPVAEHIWHPWDMPALFFGALAFMFAYRRIRWGLAATLFAGVFFKETVLVFGLLFLFFDDLPFKRRLIWCAGALAIGYGIRHGIEMAVHNPEGFNSFSYHINGNPHQMFRWKENIGWLTSTNINQVLFVNLGTLAFLFLLPSRGDSILFGFKLVAAVFYFCLFFAGSFNEFRVFVEVMPGGIFLLYTALQPVPAAAALAAPAGEAEPSPQESSAAPDEPALDESDARTSSEPPSA